MQTSKLNFVISFVFFFSCIFVARVNIDYFIKFSESDQFIIRQKLITPDFVESAVKLVSNNSEEVETLIIGDSYAKDFINILS